MNSDSVITRETAEQRRDLAAALERLTPEQWRSPSLCEGWRVREVVAHLVMPFRISVPRLLWSIARARGRFDVAADRLAHEESERLSDSDLLQTLRDNTTHPWKPPGGGAIGALSHDVIHGLDVTHALAIAPASPPARIGLVLDGLQPRHLRGFDVDLDGVRLVATDHPWTHGNGPRDVDLAVADALLVVTGRLPVPT